jgi:alpha-galactosidase/6-phospho-beta-glucosidase family protein
LAESVKLTVIGGGSSSFAPALIRRLIQSEILGNATLTLMDVDERRVRTMEGLAQKLIASAGSGLRVRGHAGPS